jgi:hypothetical protein
VRKNMKQKADNKKIINEGHNEPMEEGNYTILSEAGSDTKTWQNNKQNRVTKCMSLIFERFQRLLAMLDEFTERQIQNGRLMPDQWFWWMIVKPDVIDKYKTNLDDKGKEELDSIRFSNYNIIFWLPMLLAGIWISSIRHDMSSFADNFSFLFIEAKLYRSLLDHWGWLLVAISVGCFGARKKSESMTEELARIPGVIAVAMLVMVLINAIAGVISGNLSNGHYFIISGAIVSTVMYSIMIRISEEDSKMSIYESPGILVGWLIGSALNTKIFDFDIAIFSAALLPVILSLGVALAKATKRGWTWAGWLAAAALVISWMTISAILLWNTGNELLSIISQR